MGKLSTWFSTNKVLLIGLLSAIAMDVQQYFSNGEVVTAPVILISVGVAVTSFLAKNLRGQWITISGALGSLFLVIQSSIISHVPISWGLAISTLVLNLLAAVAPAGKSLAYEQSPTVEAAKAQAKAIDASKVPPVNPPIQTNTPKP